MKPRVFSLALLYILSGTAFAQMNSERRPQQNPTNYDPFEIMELQMKAMAAAGSPDTQPARSRNDNGTTSTVSLKQLQHQIPKAASKEYKKGLQALNDGKLSLAMKHLDSAVAIDPEFADAHLELGIVVSNLGQPTQAAAEFQRALDLSPQSTAALTNLAMVLFFQRHYHEVCQIARRSLKMDPTLVQLRYVFALSLIEDHGDLKEALANLDRASQAFPQAHLAASDVLVQIGRPDEAARHLEAYLRSVPAGDPGKAQLEARLVQLRP